MKKNNKITRKNDSSRCPPKAKVVRSNRIGCATLPLPQRGQLTEIPQGYTIEERISFVDFEPRRTLFIRQTEPVLFDIYLKSRRSKKRGESSRARSA